MPDTKDHKPEVLPDYSPAALERAFGDEFGKSFSDGERALAGNDKANDDSPNGDLGDPERSSDEEPANDDISDPNQDSPTQQTDNEEPDVEPSNKKKFQLSNLGKKVTKKKAGGALMLMLGIVGAVLIFLFILDLLKIPNYAENVAIYRLARMAQEYRSTTARLDATKISIANADDEAYKAIQEAKPNGSGKFANLRDKINSYRPEKVYQNMQTPGNEKLKYLTETKSYGPKGASVKRTKYIGVEIDGKTIKFGETDYKISKFNQLAHPITSYKEKVRFSALIQANVDNALKGYNPLVRSSVGNKIRERLNIKLRGWEKLGKAYRNTKISEAVYLQYLDETKKYSAQAADEPKAATAKVNEDADNVKNEQAKVDKDPAKVNKMLEDGKPSPEVVEAINKSGLATGPEKVIGAVSSSYAIAMPLCMIYDGSIVKMGPSIDNQLDNAQKAHYDLQSKAAQLKAGDTEPMAVAAYDYQLGKGDSAIDQAARGAPIDLSTEHGPQSDIMGSYSLVNKVLGVNSVSKDIRSVADPLCSKLTDVKWAAGILVGEVAIKAALAYFTGGTGTAATQSAEVVAKKAIESGVKSSLKRSLVKGFGKGLIFREGKVASVGLKNKTGDFLGKFAGNLVGVEAMTFVARMAVINYSEQANDPTKVIGAGAKNGAFMGADIDNNQYMRQQFFGRPLTNAEVVDDEAQITAYLKEQDSQKSSYDRYFALSNPRSMLSKFSFSLVSLKNQPVSNILQALRFENVANSLSLGQLNKTAHAATADSALDSHAGMVQWGWSKAEKALIESNESYGDVENAKALDNVDVKIISEIEEKYMPCFDETIGTILADGYINREEDGGVKADDATCSPKQLGDKNPKYGDLVFRWRIDKKFNAAIDTQLEIQNPTDDSAGSNPVSDDGAFIQGDYAWPVGIYKKDLGSPKMPCSDKPPYCHHDSSPAFDLSTKNTPDAENKPVYAITDGKVWLTKVDGNGADNCYTFHLLGKDGYDYFYGHIKNPLLTNSNASKQVKKGDKLAEIGTLECANNTINHLHIDQSKEYGHSVSSRTGNLIKVMNKLYENLPDEPTPNSGTVSGWTWPLKTDIKLNSCFNQPLDKGPHPGLDFYASSGTPVYSVASGTVVGQLGGSYGVVEIKHNNNLFSVYEHLGRIDVEKGEEISAGQKIGLSGSAGTEEPHLHFGMTEDVNVFEYAKMGEGKIVNPLKYLNNNKNYQQCSAKPETR